MISSFKKYLILIIVLLYSINIYAIVKTEDLVNLVRPAIVVITTSTKGDIGIPNFVFNIKEETFSTTTRVNGFSTTTINFESQGTGFFISDDGLIATDSYFINNKIENLYRLSAERYLQSINIDKNNLQYNKLYESVFNYILENSVKNYDLNIKIVTTTDIYEAEIIHPDFSFGADEKVTLLKIDVRNIPSVYLSDQPLSLGQKVYSVGYGLLENTISEAVFNHGFIKSIKDEKYQTDLPLYSGSEGSPVFDQGGNVIGILSSSGSIIPSSFIKQILLSKNISIKSNLYFDTYKRGLMFLENRQCKTSIIEFDKLKNINPNFSVQKYIKPQIDRCNSVIASGQSIDTFWNEILFTIEKYPYTGYLLISVILLFILYIILYKYFVNRFRKDEEKIDSILKNKDDKSFIVKTDINQNLKTPENFKFKTFEPIGQNTLQEPDLKTKYKPGDKVQIPKKEDTAPSVITPPKAIQPEGPLVVITPFKTLSKPIRSLSNSPTETTKEIKTDLPAKKKDNIL